MQFYFNLKFIKIKQNLKFSKKITLENDSNWLVKDKY